MLVIGAKGFAKEVLEVLHQSNQLENLVFYDDVNVDIPEELFRQFPVMKSEDVAANYFKTVSCKFSIGIGNPVLRKKLYDRFVTLGGEFTSTISPLATIGSFDVKIGDGSNVLSGAVFSNGSELGKGCIVYYNSIITHDCIVGDFVEISPGVILLGRSTIGSYSQIGANTTILPDIKVGKNVIIGSGSVVTKDLPDNCVAVGVPAKIIKALSPLEF
ncbi:acetyltransferase [Flavobacterium paronense]|uniref:Acetyltransferase n=1 Tax=Flavobacterium paronense TaxID=1392775 RepID=A0ABV5GAQ4_9FLAO|nr:acetyltransferase [Flavobacterium paronense]MDN3676703.1 acetyltransferase [Flavobacterium paronense]